MLHKLKSIFFFDIKRINRRFMFLCIIIKMIHTFSPHMIMIVDKPKILKFTKMWKLNFFRHAKECFLLLPCKLDRVIFLVKTFIPLGEKSLSPDKIILRININCQPFLLLILRNFIYIIPFFQKFSILLIYRTITFMGKCLILQFIL